MSKTQTSKTQPTKAQSSKPSSSKSQQQRRKSQQRETNWLLVGGLIALGVLVFGGLIYLAMQPPAPEVKLSLADYCDENPGRCIAAGEADAPVTMVEVADYGCHNCADFSNDTAGAIKQQYEETGQLRWLFLPYALNATTVQSATAGMCAAEQNAYVEFSSAMFAIEDAELRLSMDGYRQAATTAGIDPDALQACIESGKYVDTVNQNRDAAQEAGVTGTPTFFINNESLVGNHPLVDFQQQIESALSGA